MYPDDHWGMPALVNVVEWWGQSRAASLLNTILVVCHDRRLILRMRLSGIQFQAHRVSAHDT